MSQRYPIEFLDRDTLDALEGTSGTPAEGNEYVTNSDPRLTGTDFKGFWDASLNSPTLNDSNGTIGFTYEVSVAGTQDLGSGDNTFAVGDLIYYNGTTWEKNKNSSPAQTVTVAKSGGDFTSVKAAVDSITDASQVKPYVVRVYPGLYIESPFTMKSFVEIVGVGDYFGTTIATNNPNANFITGAPASLISNLIISGPTGTGFAAVDYTAEITTAMIVKNVLFAAGYYCVHCHPASAYGKIFVIQTGFNYSGSSCNTMYRVSGYGDMTCQYAVAESNTTDAIINAFVADGANARMVISDGSCNLPGTETTALTIDNGARVGAPGLTVSRAATGIKIGPNGNSVLRAHQCNLNCDNVATHIDCQTNTADLAFAGKAKYDLMSIPAGTKTAISFNESDYNGGSGFMVFGDLWLGNTQGVFPLSKFAKAYTTTGIYEQPTLTAGTGLSVNYEAGDGFVTVGGKMVPISWDAGSVALAANSSDAHIVVNSSGTVEVLSAHPEHDKVLIGTAVTDATSVVGISQHSPYIPQNIHRFFEYTREVIGSVNVSGCAVTKNGSPSRSVIVDSGVYYIHDTRTESFASSTPADLVFWHRDGSGGWIKSTGNTLINNANYDDGSGTLANLTSGYFRRDTLFITTDGTASHFHVVLGQEEFDESAAADTNPVPPDFLLSDSVLAAAIVIQEGANDITLIVDERPRLGQLSTGKTSVCDHGQLSGLSNDDHTQYQLRSEAGNANGYVPLNESTKIDEAYLDYADANPGDAKVSGGFVGTSAQLAREDHGHNVPVGIPSSIGSSNAEGVSDSLSRQDHVHAHGDQAGGTLHAVATASNNGFMSAAYAAILDGLTTSDVLDVIWAESNRKMSTSFKNGREWSFGNGSKGVCNIVMPYSGTIKKAFIHAEYPGTAASFDILINDVSVGTASFSANGVITLETLILITEGDLLGFQTTAVSGNWTDVRIGVGIAQEITGFKGDTSLNALKFRYYADQLDYPRSSDWAVNTGAPSARDATYSALTVRRFDDTTVEGVGFSTVLPLLVTDMLIRIKAKATTQPGTSAGVVWRLYWRKFPDNGTPTAWGSLVLPTQIIPTNTNVQYYDYTAPLTTWGITAGDFTQFELVREATNVNDTLIGDAALLSIELEYKIGV